MMRAIDTGVVNVSGLDILRGAIVSSRSKTQMSLAVQESADKLRILSNLESVSKGEQIPAPQGSFVKP
jgi:hypothetical protein